MSGIQRLGAIVAASLLVPLPAGARPEAIGVVVQANRASLEASAVSEGSTVFDGDRLSTGVGGALRLRSAQAMIYLKDESRVIMRTRSGNAEKVLEAELVGGQIVLSSAQGTRVEILVLNARIRPGRNTATIMQVRVLGPKTLSIFARRGMAKFSYRGEDAVIAEGQAYRVELDPEEDRSAADKKTGRPSKTFLLIAIGLIVAVTVPIIRELLESPDRP